MEKYEELRDAHKKEKNHKFGTRMLAVKMYRLNKMRVKDIVNIIDCSENTIYRWIERYDREGLDGLRDRPRSGRPPFITHNVLKKTIFEKYKKSLIVPKKLLEFIYKQFKVKFNIRYLRKLLHKLGMTPKKVTTNHIRHASHKEVRDWQRAAKKWISCLKSQEFTVLVEDEAFFQREVYPKHRFWSPTGERIYAPYIGLHENIVAYGFLGSDKEQYFRTDAKFNSSMFIKHLHGIHRKFGNVGVIMDGAAPHRSKMLKAFVRDNDWLKIRYLPCGSPYLSAVEECWHQAKQDHIIAGYHSSIKHKNDTMSSYFRHKRFDLDVLEYISRKPPPSPQNFRP